MNPRDRPAQRGPPALVGGEGDGLFIVGDEMRAEDGAHAGGLAGALELDGAVDAVGVGAGQRAEPPLCRRLRERLRARGADPEGEVGVDVEMGEHGGKGKGNGEEDFPFTLSPVPLRNCSRIRLTSAGWSSWIQWPVPSTTLCGGPPLSRWMLKGKSFDGVTTASAGPRKPARAGFGIEPQSSP